ncbi:uncharacterized protein LOC131693733 isoform X2 [Topomyia yanbarensis]|uniref:uncharacterized protein LOC131693733 isoform X2 n=1 Tax=Topomyia yanbarensis TaxID=2498891 RepID=UPI00273AFCCF|nr:uncharacterized protein LOC131693733 isoform X2 [Topomyia yanbarensis]
MAHLSMASSIEPYRKGVSFGDWVDRLEFCFVANNVDENLKKAHFITLAGPLVYAELKLQYPVENLNNVSYNDMVKKLKNRFDKKPSCLVQRLKFSNRVQQPDESLEDYVLSVKLQAEFCSFGEFKNQAIRDRIISGIRDTRLQEKILNEDEDLNVEATEKIIMTWEMAKCNAKSLGIENKTESLAPLNAIRRPRGLMLEKLGATLEAARVANQPGSSKVPIRDRLGFTPYARNSPRYRGNNQNSRMTEWNNGLDKVKKDHSQLICDFCGKKGHIKKKCFRLKNLHRDAVKFVDSWNEPGPNTDRSLSELFDRMRADDVESDNNDDKDYDWKRANNGTPYSAKSS